ncbi:hypothetical protein PSENEW3_00004050 [Picochlorum sp. SENEW3]|nr:hypothetical protein PSENEW3_00004050 [Picochlorum sp. SENEW3]
MMRSSALLLIAILAGVSAERKLLQTECGPLVDGVINPPENAVLYLSVRGEGEITYKCTEANKPVVLSEKGEFAADPEISEGWTAEAETKDGVLQLTTTNSNPDPSAKNTLTLGDQPVVRPRVNGAPDARWVVVSNEGSSAAQGGIPGNNYVTRTESEGGAPPRTCEAGETVDVPLESTFNIYSCDRAYLVGDAPASAPTADEPAAAPVTADVPEPSTERPAAAPVTVDVPEPSTERPAPSPVVVVPAPEPTVAPVPVPSPAAVPPSPSPVPVPVPVAPAPAPASAASSLSVAIASIASLVAALFA